MPDLTVDDLLYKAVTLLKAEGDRESMAVIAMIEEIWHTEEYLDAEEQDDEDSMRSLAISSLRKVANHCLQVVTLIA